MMYRYRLALFLIKLGMQRCTAGSASSRDSNSGAISCRRAQFVISRWQRPPFLCLIFLLLLHVLPLKQHLKINRRAGSSAAGEKNCMKNCCSSRVPAKKVATAAVAAAAAAACNEVKIVLKHQFAAGTAAAELRSLLLRFALRPYNLMLGDAR